MDIIKNNHIVLKQLNPSFEVCPRPSQCMLLTPKNGPASATATSALLRTQAGPAAGGRFPRLAHPGPGAEPVCTCSDSVGTRVASVDTFCKFKFKFSLKIKLKV